MDNVLCSGQGKLFIVFTLQRFTLDDQDMSPADSNDRVMICWICGVSAGDKVRSDSLLENLGFDDLQSMLHSNRLDIISRMRMT